MKYLLPLLFLVGCTIKTDNKLSVSKADIEMARCICQQRNQNMLNVTRDGDAIYFYCAKEGDSSRFTHLDKTYTEGCTR